MFYGGGGGMGGGMGGGGMGGGGPMGGGGMMVGGRLRSSIDAADDEILGKVYDAKVLGRMTRYLAPAKTNITFGFIGSLIRTAAQAITPLMVGIIIDDYIRTRELDNLGIMVLLLIGVQLLMWGGQYMQTMFLAYAGQTVLLKMRTEMFDHLHKLSMSFFDQNKVGKLMSRVQNDVNQLQEVLTMGIANLVTNILLLVGIIIIMVSMNPKLAVITLSVVPLLGIIMVIWQIYSRKVFISVRRAIAEVNDQLQQGVSGVRVTQSLSREKVNISEFEGVNRAHLDANISAAKLQALMMPTVQIMTGIAYALIIIYGGRDVIAGTLGVGVLTAFILYVQRFFDPIVELTMMYTQLQRATASGARIFELLDVKPEINDRPDAKEMPPVKGSIKFDKVKFGYNAEVEVLHGIDLEVKPGETVAIVGSTGAGKSSLISLCSRFYEPTSGEITIDGHNLNSVTQESLRRQIGIVPQDAFLFSGTIEDNIRYGKLDASREEVIEAAKTAGIHEFISHLTKEYDTPVGERGGNLSAGQRQLVCLARAVLANPPIIVLDEATSNVDTNTERVMQESLRRLSKGRTCLIIAHRLSTITHADKIIVMQKGNIIESGTHDELLAKQGVYYNMYETLNAVQT